MERLTFLDLCSGIGGFRCALESIGHRCVGYCEIDRHARASYEAMFDTEGEWKRDDINDLRAEEIPYADIWCFGFPCQDITNEGKMRGLDGERSGLFLKIMELIKEKLEGERPTYLLIENVRNLLSVNGGWDFARVLSELDTAGYDCRWQLLDSRWFGVPQRRERVYIIGYLRSRGRREILPIRGTYTTAPVPGGPDGPSVKVKNATKSGYAIAHVGDGINLAYPDSETRRGRVGSGVAQTLVCSGQMGTLTEDGRIRRLTPREYFRLQGFPDELYERAAKVCTETQLYKQAGNAVTVNVARAVALALPR